MGKYIVSEPLANIFNQSISCGIYPDKLKLAKIISVFKADDATEAGCYRPISLLSVFNRIFEKLMFTRLSKFVDKYDILRVSYET